MNCSDRKENDTKLLWAFTSAKSVSVGPFRFNLSKSGIGVSAGIKGLRIGTGPRGNYVQMGRGGIYFRQTIPSSDSRRTPSLVPQEQSQVPEEQSSIDFKEIESGSVSQMVDSSSAAILDEINSKSRKMLIWPWVLAVGIGLPIALAAASLPDWTYFLLVALSAGGLFWAVRADKLRKTVVLFYELERHIEAAYQNLHKDFDAMRSCSRMWHIQSRGNVVTKHDWKMNAGASAIVKRKTITLRSARRRISKATSRFLFSRLEDKSFIFCQTEFWFGTRTAWGLLALNKST